MNLLASAPITLGIAGPRATFGPAQSIRRIQERVADFYGLRRIEMTSARRDRKVAHPRQVAMYLARHLTPKSLPDIGRRFGGRDHTTVIHAVRAVEARIAADPEAWREVLFLWGELEG